MGFATFALSQLPRPPARVLEVGCGSRGGITLTLAERGYEVTAIDPVAPVGDHFRAVTLEAFPEERFDAVVAERVFHHVHPLAQAVEKVARMTELVILEEFAWDKMDAATRDWYESQHRALVAAGQEPKGPPDLEQWREDHADLHPSYALLCAFNACFDEQHSERRPYLYRWLGGPATEALESTLIRAGAIQPLGFRWIGIRK